MVNRFTAGLRRLHARFPMTRGAAYSIVFLFLLSAVLTAGSYALSTRAIMQSQHRWCAVLALLTSQAAPKVPPPGPHATAAQRDAYRTWVFYGDLVRLRRGYGCG